MKSPKQVRKNTATWYTNDRMKECVGIYTDESKTKEGTKEAFQAKGNMANIILFFTSTNRKLHYCFAKKDYHPIMQRMICFD